MSSLLDDNRDAFLFRLIAQLYLVRFRAWTGATCLV